MFGVSRQAVYQAEKRLLQRTEQLEQIKSLVLNKRSIMPRIGTRKLYFLLKDDFNRLGIKIGRDALFTYLKSQHLLIKPSRSYTKTTNSKHWLKKHPNLLKEQVINRPEQVFVSDITYVKSRENTHYLSLVTDAYSRKIMGYHLSDDLSANSVVKALKMAKKNRITSDKLIHHSDRGLQYCSELYQKELGQIIPSMTDGYDCYQNALAERVNGILKHEFLINKCNTRNELARYVKESIEIYNQERPHTSINFETPNFRHQKTRKLTLTG